MMAASRLQNQSVPLIIANIIGVGSIVYYAFPNQLVNYAKGFALAIGYPLTPYFSSVIGKNNSGELRKAWLNTTFLLQAIMFIMPVVLWQYGEAFLRLWIGLEYAEAGRWVLKALVIGMIFETLAVNSFRVLTAQATHGKGAIIWLILAALSIPAGVFGGKLWGVEGVAAGVASVSVGGNLVTVALACASLNISHKEYILATCMKLILPFALCAAFSELLFLFSTINNYLILLLHVSSVVLLYGVLVWVFSLDSAMKWAILQHLRSKLKQK